MNLIEKSIQLVDDGHIDEALSILSNYVTRCSEDEQAIIAQLYMEWGLLDEAMAIFEPLLQLYPENSDLKLLLSSIYIDLQRDEDALHLLHSIDERDAAYSEALLQEADLYESQGLYEVAERKLLEVKQLKPDNIIIDFALGELLFSSGQFNRAITHYERVLNKEDHIASIDINERIAECLSASGEFEQSLAYYESIESTHSDSFFKHGLTAHYAKRNPIAIDIWYKLIEHDPYYHTVYPQLAFVLFEELRLDEAYTIINKGLKYDEYNKELYLLAAKITGKLGKHDDSEQYVKQAIELDADYKEAILFFTELLKGREDHEEIIELINDIKLANVYDPDYEWELARAYYETDLYDESLKTYKTIYQDLIDNPIFVKEYGYFLSEEGLTSEAIMVLNTYITMVPDDEDTIQFLERLTMLND